MTCSSQYQKPRNMFITYQLSIKYTLNGTPSIFSMGSSPTSAGVWQILRVSTIYAARLATPNIDSNLCSGSLMNYLYVQTGILIIGNKGIFSTILTSWQTIFGLRSLVARGYAQAEGKPFAIPHHDRYLIFVSSSEQSKEFYDETTRKNSKLSMRGIFFDVSQTELR